MKRGLVLLSLAAAVTGCTLGPEYRRPDTAVPAEYRLPGPVPAGETIANLPWWQLFEDPELRGLIETALRENKDLGVAVARIEEARARLGVTTADQYPTVAASGSAQRTQQSENVLPGAGPRNDFVLAGQVSFEVDLWGKYRRATEASRAELLAAEEARRVVVFTLVSDVASLYFQLRDLDAKLEVTRRTLEGRRESVRLMRQRFEGGLIPQLDLHQAEMQEASAAAGVPVFERQIAVTENALSILLGHYPGPIGRGKALEAQVLPPDVPAGLPSELLERRPDVRLAEQALHAQTALIGVAEAARFPSFSLTGSLGLKSAELDELLGSDAGYWSFGGSLLQTILDFGRNKQRVEIERARTEQAVLQYQRAVQQAVKDVADALVAVRTYREEREQRLRQLQSARDASSLSWERYNGGVTSYLEVLDAERSLYSTELEASTALEGQVLSVVGLYKALGGGWQAENPQAAVPRTR